jgi:hypothetical protein
LDAAMTGTGSGNQASEDFKNFGDCAEIVWLTDDSRSFVNHLNLLDSTRWLLDGCDLLNPLSALTQIVVWAFEIWSCEYHMSRH